jgi:hyperosmotically inducible periplasmic protein
MNSKFLIGALGSALLGIAMTVPAGEIRSEEPATTPGLASQDTSAQPGTDAWITTKVKADLMTTKEVPGTAISVSTMNGVVTLAGVVDNKDQIRKSVAVAKGIKGVRSVDSSALNSRN